MTKSSSSPKTQTKTPKTKLLQEFKDFINRGSVVDLAVGVIVGGAFSSIVTSLVDNIIMPLIGIIIGGIDFSNLSIKVSNFDGSQTAVLKYGLFIQNVIDFLIIAFVIFLVVRILSRMRAKLHSAEAAKDKAEEKQEDENTKLLREIRDSLVAQSKTTK